MFVFCLPTTNFDDFDVNGHQYNPIHDTPISCAVGYHWIASRTADDWVLWHRFSSLGRSSYASFILMDRHRMTWDEVTTKALVNLNFDVEDANPAAPPFLESDSMILMMLFETALSALFALEAHFRC